MGRTVRLIAGAALLVASFFVPGSSSLYFAIGGLNVAASTAFVLQTLGALSLTLGLSPRIPGLDVQDQLAENLHIFSSPLATRAIPFGRVPVAGQILYRSNIEGSGDTPDEVLLILGLAGYPGDALEKFWLNGELVFDGDSTTGPGAITSGTFADDLWVWFRTGHETSQAFPDIATLDSVWDEKSRILRGIPAIGLRVKVTEDLEGRLEPLAQFRGGRWYDPRLDSTVPGGSGTHRIDDQDTWEFSVNPKIAELAYLIGGEVNGKRIFGMGKSAAAIDLENFASEANICEEQIDVVGGGTIDRYTCNGLLVPEPDHRTNLNKLLSASAGTMDASGGIYRTFAGAWRSPSMTLTESDIDGAPTNIELQKDPSEETNIVRGSFSDPNEEGQVKEYPELRDSASITQIGENPMTLDLPFTNDHRMAQRIAKITLRRENAARKFAGNYWLRTLSLQPGDIVTQTYGRYTIDAETFRVDVWGVEAGEDRDGAQRLMVPMQLVEEQQSWFDWDEATEEQSLTGVTSLLPNMDRRPKMIELDGVPVFEGSAPPANPKIGWLWLDTDVDTVFRWSGSAWVEYSKIGADGTDGTLKEFVFQRSVTQPATPAGDGIPTGWFDDPPGGSNPLWFSTAEQQLDGTTIGAWSTPRRLDAAGGTNALNIGRRLNVLEEWYAAFDQSATLDTDANFSIVTPADAPIWATALQAVGSGNDAFFSERMTLDTTRKHRVSVWAEQPSGDRTAYLLVAFYDSNGDLINNGSTPVSDATGWTGLGSFHYWQISNAAFTTDWSLYQFEFGGDATATIPTGAVSFAIGALVTRSTPGTTETTQRFHDYYVVELADDGQDGTDGTDGGDGLSVYLANVFQRSASAPATPTGGSYDFGTRTLTPPSGWSVSPPASDGNPLYVSTGSFSVQGTTGVDNSTTWTSPDLLVEDGADGTDGQDGTPGSDGDDGLSVHVANVYQRSASAPSTPTGGSYDFGTNTLTPPSGWSVTPPASDGNPLYVSTASFSIIGQTGTDSSTTWSSPDVLVQDGEDAPGFVTLPFDVQDNQSGTLPQSAGIVFTSDGLIQAYANGSLTTIGKWWSNAPETGIGDSHEVRNEAQLAGTWDLSAGSVGSWVSLSSDATWRVVRTIMEGAGSDSADSNFQIRAAATPNTIEDEVIGGGSASS